MRAPHFILAIAVALVTSFGLRAAAWRLHHGPAGWAGSQFGRGFGPGGWGGHCGPGGPGGYFGPWGQGRPATGPVPVQPAPPTPPATPAQ